MKKTIVIELLLLLILSILLAITIRYSNLFKINLTNLKYVYATEESLEKATSTFLQKWLPYVIILPIACVADFFVILLIAIKDFPVFKPLLDKINARREEHAQAKAEKAKADKQEKIKALEQQLEELKKDGE